MRKTPLIAVCLGTFMLLIDVTIVNVALPDMALDLHSSFTALQWVIDIYALVLAALLLSVGSVADIFGRRTVYVLGLILFAAASLACGLAPNGSFLIVARGIQGVGAAAMFATTVALLNTSYEGRERGIAYGIWGAVAGAAASIGPTIGGVLTESLSWRWIFFVNLPISAVAVAMSLVVLDGSRGSHRLRLDFAGMVTFTASAALLTYGFIRAGESGWLAGSTLGLLIGGLVALAVFVVVERRVAAPMLDLNLFSDRRFTGVIIAALFLSFSAFAYLVYSSIWLQSVRDLSPLKAGLVYLPLSVAAFVVSAVIGRRLHGTDPRWIISVGLLLIGVGGLGQAILSANSSWPLLLAGLFFVGVGVGLVNPTIANTVMAAVPLHRSGMGSGAMNTARQLGLAFGIALLGTVFRSRVSHELAAAGVSQAEDVAAAVSGGQRQAVLAAAPEQLRSALDGAIHTAFTSGLNTIFVVGGAGGVLAAVAVWFLLRPLSGSAGRPPVAPAQSVGPGTEIAA